MRESINVKVISATPGADSNTYNLFDSTVTFKAPFANASTTLPAHDISRVEVSLVNDQSGTLKAYRSTNGGTNWDEFGNDIAVVASSSTDINGPYDYLVDPHVDVKIDWVNGGSAQGTWRPSVVLIRGYHGSAV